MEMILPIILMISITLLTFIVMLIILFKEKLDLKI